MKFGRRTIQRLHRSVLVTERDSHGDFGTRRKRRVAGSVGETDIGVKTFGNLTYSSNGFENARKYAVDEGPATATVGTLGIEWVGGGSAGYWYSTIGGVYWMQHKVEYEIPAGGWEPNCDPSAAINVAKAIRRQHKIAILILNSGGGPTEYKYNQREHTNFGVATYVGIGSRPDVYSLTVTSVHNVSVGDKVYAFIEGYQWPIPGDMILWGTTLAEMTFIRLNDKMQIP